MIGYSSNFKPSFRSIVSIQNQRIDSAKEELAELEKQVANSSEKNRNFLAATLVILLYLAVVVVQTTDVDLLIGKAVKLPVIELDMPLFVFYIAAPLLVVAIHFNLLQNIESHYYKLCQWRDAYPKTTDAEAQSIVPRWRIYPFIFDYATLEKGSVFGGVTSFASQLLIYWSGPLVGFATMWRFSDYQSGYSTTWHYACLLIDLWLVMLCRQRMDSDPLKPEIKNGWRALYRVPLGLHGMGALMGNKGDNDVIAMYISTLAFLGFIFYWGWLYGPAELFPRNGDAIFVPKIVINAKDDLLVLNDKQLRLRYELSSDKTDAKKSFQQWFMSEGHGLNLRDRSLRFANFSQADLRRANLTGADLSGANLRDANINGAFFYEKYNGIDRVADLSGVDFSGSQLEKFNFDHFNLRGAIFFGANLRGASFRHANLQGATFIAADIQGSDMSYAQLQAATLGAAKITGTNFNGASLVGVAESGYGLEGVLISKTSIWGTEAELNSEFRNAIPLNAESIVITVPLERDWLHWRSSMINLHERIKFDEAKERVDMCLLASYKDCMPNAPLMIFKSNASKRLEEMITPLKLRLCLKEGGATADMNAIRLAVVHRYHATLSDTSTIPPYGLARLKLLIKVLEAPDFCTSTISK